MISVPVFTLVHFLEVLKSVFHEKRNEMDLKERNEMELKERNVVEREKQNVFAFTLVRLATQLVNHSCELVAASLM